MPACTDTKDQHQTGYTLEIFKDGSATSVWSSGKVSSNASVSVAYDGPVLEAGIAYQWTVQTTSSGCTSAASEKALFITAKGAFAPSAKWIGAGVSNATFNLLRRVVQAPAGVRRAIGYITAQNSDPTM